MKKTLLLALIVITATVIQAQKQQVKSNTNLQKLPTLVKSSDNNLKDLNYSFIETFDDSVLTNTNGLPVGWSYTPNSSNILDQWTWYNFTGNGCLYKAYHDTNIVLEAIYTDTYTVPSSDAYLSFSFMCSYYWMIDNGTDSVEIYYTIDGGGTWSSIWSNSNPAYIEASGISWPYSSGEWLIPMIELPTSTYNQNISFKIVYNGGTGNYFLIDNFAIGQSNSNDLAFLEIYSNFGETYIDGWYSNIPLNQVQQFKSSRILVKNIGSNTQTGIIVDLNIGYNGSNIYSNNENVFINGNDSISEFNTFDTMMIYSDFTANQIGSYEVKYTLSQNEVDEDLSDNETVYNFNITDSKYSRYDTINAKASPINYAGCADGDMVGCSFKFINPTKVDSVSCYIADGTTDNSAIQARVFKYNNYTSTYDLVEMSDDYNLLTSDIGNTINLPILNSVTLDTGVYNIVIQCRWTPGSSEVYIGSQKDYFYNTTQFSSLLLGSTWYYINDMPAIDVYIEPIITSDITASADFGSANAFADSSVALSLYRDNSGVVELFRNPTAMIGGSINFGSLLDGNYYLKSELIDTLAYPTVMPVYFYDGPTIDSASIINLSSGMSVNRNVNHPIISLIPGTNSIQGTLNTITKSTNDLSGEIAVLQDAMTNEVLTVSITDENGHYWFGDVTDDLSVKVYFTSFNYPDWNAASLYTNNDSNYVINFIVNGDSIYPDGFVNTNNITVENINFSIYPNPAKDILYLDNILRNSIVKIFSQTGKLIILDERSEISSIDISDLSQGEYIMVVTSKDGKLGTKKFVKK